jgi:hypothetical protein
MFTNFNRSPVGGGAAPQTSFHCHKRECVRHCAWNTLPIFFVGRVQWSEPAIDCQPLNNLLPRNGENVHPGPELIIELVPVLGSRGDRDRERQYMDG